MELNQDNAFKILNNAKKTLEEKAVPKEKIDKELSKAMLRATKRHKHLFN